ncbi:MAG TPA: tetratricopeptide repeat protein [Burkholderiaceae bacterium]|nr:tetratricopeptide repeat protein [Burkholderiaceae bacterium]
MNRPVAKPLAGEGQSSHHSLKSVRQMLGLSAATLSGLVDAGFVTPSRGPRNEYRFSFQDIVLLRTAHRLRSARIPPRRIVEAMRSLREQLPGQLPLSGLRISAVGNDVAVQHGGVQWAAESRQMLLDFDVAPAGGTVSLIGREFHAAAAPPRPLATAGADERLARARELEASDPGSAEQAYRDAIAHGADTADAHLNLGALLYESSRLDEALAAYDQGLVHHPGEPRLHYNRALALEDLHRPGDALAAYDACLRRAPDFADAHFNAARLAEQLGKDQLALRHFSAYRRLER